MSTGVFQAGTTPTAFNKVAAPVTPLKSRQLSEFDQVYVKYMLLHAAVEEWSMCIHFNEALAL